MSEATKMMKAARRVVADVGRDGKSCVTFDEPVPPADLQRAVRLTNLWMAPMARPDNASAFDGGFEPWTAGQMSADIYTMTLVDYAPGVGARDPGMHASATVDHFHVIDGEIVMVLETGEAVLRAGDTGIIRGAVHGWRNDGTATARLIFFVLPALPLAGQDVEDADA